MNQHALQSVWRLDAAGEWEVLSHERSERFSGVAEMIAIMVSSELGERAELHARFGAETLEVRAVEGAVTVLLRKNDVHPLVVKTALQRVELASVRSARVQQSVELNVHRPPARLFRLDDGASATSFRVASANRRLATAPNGGPLLASSDELCDIEIDFLNEANDEPGTVLKCTWGEAAAWIEDAIQWSAGFVGRSVASNYWRELLRSESRLTAVTRVTHEAKVVVDSGAEERIASSDARALQTLHDVWLTRCSRVIPNASVVASKALRSAPWRNALPGRARSDR